MHSVTSAVFYLDIYDIIYLSNFISMATFISGFFRLVDSNYILIRLICLLNLISRKHFVKITRDSVCRHLHVPDFQENG